MILLVNLSLIDVNMICVCFESNAVIWKTNRNYTLNAGAMFRGRFADVSAALVRAFGRARPAPIATFYKGNRVLVIETMEDENAYE